MTPTKSSDIDDESITDSIQSKISRGKRIRTKPFDSSCSSPLSVNDSDFNNDKYRSLSQDSYESNNDAHLDNKQRSSYPSRSPKSVRIHTTKTSQSESDDLLHDYTEKIKKLNDLRNNSTERFEKQKEYSGEKMTGPTARLSIGVPLLGKKTRDSLKERIIV